MSEKHHEFFGFGTVVKIVVVLLVGMFAYGTVTKWMFGSAGDTASGPPGTSAEVSGPPPVPGAPPAPAAPAPLAAPVPVSAPAPVAPQQAAAVPAAEPVAPAAEPAAPAPTYQYEPGLIGLVFAPSQPGRPKTMLWEFAIDAANSNWKYGLFSKFGPSPGLINPLPTGLEGALDITATGKWGVRMRGEIANPNYAPTPACQVAVTVEGQTILQGAITEATKSLSATLSLPETGLYKISAAMDCTSPESTLALEVLPPGRAIWEPAPVRRPIRPIATAATPDAASGVLVINRGQTNAPKWLQQVQVLKVQVGNTNQLEIVETGDVIAELPQMQADALPVANANLPPVPAGSGITTAYVHRSEFKTMQTISEKGVWVYYVSIENTTKATKGMNQCAASLSIEGQPVISKTTLRGPNNGVGGQYREDGSWAVVGSAELAPGAYSLSLTNVCHTGLPETIRVWVKGPKDTGAIRPLRADEVAVKVAL